MFCFSHHKSQGMSKQNLKRNPRAKCARELLYTSACALSFAPTARPQGCKLQSRFSSHC